MRTQLRRILGLTALLVLCPVLSTAHVGHHPSVHDTVAGVIQRIRKTVPAQEVQNWKLTTVQNFLTPQEKETLGAEHIRFSINQPATLFVVRPRDPMEELFWLESSGFHKSDIKWRENREDLTLWQKEVKPGSIGLGVNSLRGGGKHYLVVLVPRTNPTGFKVTDLYPGQLRLVGLTNGVKAYVDQEARLADIPASLQGALLIQTKHSARDDAKLLDIFRFTEHPAGPRPDQIVLTWSQDPKTTQTIQWRTSTNVKKGTVLFAKKEDISPLRTRKPKFSRVRALTETLSTPNVLNDPVVHRHSVTLRDLEPATTYVYSVGEGKHWSAEGEFTTAPPGIKPFSFIYMGDAQNGLDRWGTLLKNAFRSRPDAAFYIMAGDLVNRGADRDDWDSFFYNAEGVYNSRQLIPVIGNHECQGGHPTLYLKLFSLLTNGPPKVEKERAYYFEYSNALFVVLDSNLEPATQTEWLDEVLSKSKATWKFVTYHHPAYSSAPARDNKTLRQAWAPLFDKYHVDLALQGHDHAYLRTYPMYAEKTVDSPQKGTVYIVSVSGTKMYDQDQRDYTAFGMTNVATYQVLDIQISGDRLVYRAYDIDGHLKDELIIEKKGK
jgi:acid phosphatase type 7